MSTPNLRLWSRSLRMAGGSWYARDDRDVERAFKLLREYQEQEPSGDWILQTRGTESDWHEYRKDGAR